MVAKKKRKGQEPRSPTNWSPSAIQFTPGQFAPVLPAQQLWNNGNLGFTRPDVEWYVDTSLASSGFVSATLDFNVEPCKDLLLDDDCYVFFNRHFLSESARMYPFFEDHVDFDCKSCLSQSGYSMATFLACPCFVSSNGFHRLTADSPDAILAAMDIHTCNDCVICNPPPLKCSCSGAPRLSLEKEAFVLPDWASHVLKFTPPKQRSSSGHSVVEIERGLTSLLFDRCTSQIIGYYDLDITLRIPAMLPSRFVGSDKRYAKSKSNTQRRSRQARSNTSSECLTTTKLGAMFQDLILET